MQSFCLGITALAFVLCNATWAADPTDAGTAKGIVYHDKNGNGARDVGEPGLPNVGVSNGLEVTSTDKDGNYQLPLTTDTTIFITKPAQWRTARDAHQLPRFYYTHKPAGSPATLEYAGVAPTGDLPASIDFALYPQDEPETFHVIFFGDPQPRDIAEVNYIAHDVVEELIGTDAVFGVTLGDIVFNDLSVFPALNGVVGTLGVPWYNVIGNHDLNMDVPDDRLSDETYERFYGPNYYAFNYAKVSFIVLDNVAWDGKDYHGEFGQRQLQWVKNTLAQIPMDNLVVVMMHIPLNTTDDRAELLRMLEPRPHTFSVSAHWHRQGTFFLSPSEGEPGKHHHLVHGTVSGSWWGGAKDEFGIPHAAMSDGTPNGYSIGTFKGAEYSLKYKASRRPPEFQMAIYAPEAVPAKDTAQQEVVVNVFMGSTQSTVDMRMGDGGEWTPMTLTERQDPFYVEMKEREFGISKALGRGMPDTATSTHLWVANLPANLSPGTHVIHVRTKDMFGQQFEGHRIIRVE